MADVSSRMIGKQQRHSCMHAPGTTSAHEYYCIEQTFMQMIREHGCSAHKPCTLLPMRIFVHTFCLAMHSCLAITR